MSHETSSNFISNLVTHSIMNVSELYWKDPYMSETRAKIIEIIEPDMLVLEPNIFHPRGGGQPSDKGEIITLDGQKYEVLDVKKTRGRTMIKIENVSGFKKQDEVIARIDLDYRLNLMKAHTAQHLVSAMIKKLTNVDTTKVEILENAAKIFLKEKISIDVIKKALYEANLSISKQLPVKSLFVDPRKESSVELDLSRGKIPAKESIIRILQIGDLDRVPCSGTHVKNLGEIGYISLVDFKGDYLEIIVGERALNFLISSSVDLVSMATKIHQPLSGVLDFLLNKKNQLESRQQELVVALKNVFLNLVRLEKGFTVNGVSLKLFHIEALDQSVAARIADFEEQPGSIEVLLTGDGFIVIHSASRITAKELFDALKSKFPTLKGGGKEHYVRGKFDPEYLESLKNEIIKSFSELAK